MALFYQKIRGPAGQNDSEDRYEKPFQDVIEHLAREEEVKGSDMEWEKVYGIIDE